MAKFSLEKQTYEVPGSRVPGSTGKNIKLVHIKIIVSLSAYITFTWLYILRQKKKCYNKKRSIKLIYTITQ
jgi:hypothetical protein